MFYPDVPLIHAVLVITIVVLANKGLDVLIAKSKREKAVDGIPEEAVRDGVIRKAFIASTTFSKYELFQQLRKNERTLARWRMRTWKLTASSVFSKLLAPIRAYRLCLPVNVPSGTLPLQDGRLTVAASALSR